MTEVIALALALSMDAFAVSIGLGTKQATGHGALAFKAGLFFGIFQALMPLIGYIGGKGLLGFIDHYTRYVAFALLVLIGAKMVYESMQENLEEEIQKITNKLMLTLAIATSIDAMAAGFSLMLLDMNPLLACGLIGFVTFCMSFLGVFVGKLTGNWLESKAELLGGIVLVAIGIRIVTA
ncbi:manganese efflux pump MntP family protein [Sulfurospirillum sp. hDNRA2]|jgi:putative Mn2+ efflux pump MntP|uniref:manganese efflux pump MntP n=1 Tax=Sulfurospirillum sp. hDNRA2 TaxID=3237298 RepID=UPI0020B6B2D6|nr:manganese efflux pump MntP family protein [Sulfurospirillum sp. DNRA8]MCP3651918.1 manganese efflux pump MntP family protein [Sulfurospirillum sp. DNRA8]MCR1810765.1 manganese efflux pump MntP family protein [Sulfurospirillum sp. DNRA8]